MVLFYESVEGLQITLENLVCYCNKRKYCVNVGTLLKSKTKLLFLETPVRQEITEMTFLKTLNDLNI